MAATVRPRAFAVWFKDLVRWNPGSFVQSDWRWPKKFIKPLSVALKVRRIEANIDHVDFSAMPLITIRLDGGMEPRSSKVTTDIKGKLFLAYAGDVVYSKIDVRSGAIGIVPESLPVVAVTNEFPVYEVRKDVALPLYIKLLFRAEFFRRTINSMISGASGRKRVQPTQLVDVEVPLPPLPVQQAIVDYWQSTQARITDAENRLVDLKQRVNNYLHSLTVMEPCERKVLALSWDKLESWDDHPAPPPSSWQIRRSSLLASMQTRRPKWYGQSWNRKKTGQCTASTIRLGCFSAIFKRVLTLTPPTSGFARTGSFTIRPARRSAHLV
jgi:type I restriction enzyme S subunit